MDEVLDSYAVGAKEVQLPDPRWRIAMAERSAPKTSSGLARERTIDTRRHEETARPGFGLTRRDPRAEAGDALRICRKDLED